MSYFEDIYLKRINRFGNNIQERLQNKREYDFENTVMKKSPNLVSVWEGINNWEEASEEPNYKGILQTKDYDQDEVVDYLLVPCDREVPMGRLLWFRDIRHENRTFPFLAYAKDPYTTQGYNRYTVIELEENLTWVFDGLEYSCPVHAAGGGSGARDKNINLKFRTQFSESGVYLPNKRYSIVMPTQPTLHKNHKVTLGEETWRVTGFDKISVSGVMYVTLEESLTDKTDDKFPANKIEKENWSIVSRQGNPFEINATEDFSLVMFDAYYKNEVKIVNIVPTITTGTEFFGVATTTSTVPFKSGQPFYITQNSSGSHEGGLQIFIKSDNEGESNKFDFSFTSVSNVEIPITIAGPRTIYVGDTIEYTVQNATTTITSAKILSADSREPIDQSFAVITAINDNNKTLTIKAKDIGKIILSVPQENITVEQEIDIQSMWLGGNTNVNT